METLLEVRDLKTHFFTDGGVAKAVDGISFSVGKGETVGIVGESGSGKSVTALSILGLHTGKVMGGEVVFEGKDLLKLSKTELQKIRGGDISMIFQDPMTSLDPVFTVGFQLREAIKKHQNVKSNAEANRIAVEALCKVGIPQPEARIKNYPHQLSGGMRQRVIIAMALCCHSKLIIADEITTALDMTIQAQILELLREIKANSGTSILLITHDLGVVAEMCDRVIVMYCGRVIERGTAEQIFHNPQHQYTKGLLSSIPRIEKEVDRLSVIPGVVPSITNLPDGCRFHPRCDMACERCLEQIPELREVEPGHFTACCCAQGYDKEEQK